jgi:broad specificity phosphatase PhoE
MSVTPRLVAALAALLFVFPVRVSGQTPQPVTLFIVRHAEKGSLATDPPLTGVGRERARDLARMLKDSGVTVIYATQFRRTQETAEPLAKELDKSPIVTDATKPAELAVELKALEPGTKALVVSHSNIVPILIQKLTGDSVGEITELEYDRLYVVSLTPSGGTVVFLHYGER